MSVSVLSVADSGPLFRSASRPGSDHATRMSGPPPNLKRPWEQEHSPPQSSHSAFHRQQPQQLQHQHQVDARYHHDQHDHATQDAMSSQYGQPLSRQASYGTAAYTEPQIGPVPPRDLSHKRTRVDAESNAMSYSTGSRPTGRTSPAPTHSTQMPSRLPSIGQSAGPRPSVDRHSVSPRTGSPQSGFYHAHGHAPVAGPVLPSPASVTSSAGGNPPQHPLRSMNSSLLSPVSPATTHLQNLQHELSTKSLAYSNLAGEHERLLGAYSRLQTRLATLDRKSKTADGELTMLQEERISLQERVDGLEKEVDEVRAAKESETEQRNQESEQWRRIIDLSGLVQKRHTEESEKWKAEKEGLLRRVEGLEGELRRVRLGTASPTSGEAYEGANPTSLTVGDDALAAGPADAATGSVGASRFETETVMALRTEAASLRSQTEQSKRLLDEYRSRMGELRELLTKADGLMDVDREGSTSSR